MSVKLTDKQLEKILSVLKTFPELRLGLPRQSRRFLEAVLWMTRSGSQSIAHNPSVLVLDEPLNGLDPMARAEIIRLFRQLADAGMYLVISSHILHEVDMMSDSVVLLHNGYVVAEGEVHGVRDEIEEHPIQILIRCDQPQVLAARLFEHEHTVEARIHDDRKGLFVKTRRPDDFYLLLNKVITEQNLQVESVAPVDDDLNAVYQYLITSDGGQT